MKVLIRCDGSTEIGLGHVVRCLALADELRDSHGCDVIFAMRESEVGIAMVRETYPVLTPHVDNSAFDYETWMMDLVKLENPAVLILDVRDELCGYVLERIKLLNVLIVDIDDPENKRLKADMAFYPPVPQVKEMCWKDFSGKLFCGWEWVILKKEFRSRSLAPSKRDARRPKLLVTMGGSDPKGMTIKAVEAIGCLNHLDFNVDIVVGRGFTLKDELVRKLDKCEFPFQIHENVKHMPDLMSTAHMAVCSFGVTAYELAAAGVPAIHFCLSEDHVRSSESFVRCGIARSMGLYQQIDESSLAGEIAAMITREDERVAMAEKGQQLMGTNGAQSIADAITSTILLKQE